ncbi:MAG: hypothetical protein ACXVPN_14600 [Bacteroidia bacterium]
MKNVAQYKKQILIFGCFFFIVQLILAVIFYRERLYADSSYFIFKPINNSWFYSEHKRFLLTACQVLPLIGSYMGLPLKIVLILYSLNHVFFFFALFLLLVLKLDDVYGGMAIMGVLVLNFLGLYAQPYLETWYATGLAVVFYSLLRSDKNSTPILLLIVLLEITIIFSHPENIILVAIFTLLFLKAKPLPLTFRDSEQSKPFIVLAILALAALYKFTTLDKYENEHVGLALTAADQGSLVEMIKVTSIQIFSVLWHNFKIPFLLLLLTLLAYIKNAQYRRASILLLTFSGFIAMVNILYREDELTMYSAIHYLPVVAVCVIPFFYDALSTYSGRTKNVAITLLFICFIIRNAEQINRIKPFTYAVENTERLISLCDKAGGNKFFIKYPHFVDSFVDWTHPIQTLLLSAERGPDKCRSIASNEDTAAIHSTKSIFTDAGHFMISRFEITANDSLNLKYFHIAPGTYKTVDYDSCLAPFYASQLNIGGNNNGWNTKQAETFQGKPGIHFTGDEFGLALTIPNDNFEDKSKEYYARVNLTRFDQKAIGEALVVCDIMDKENNKHVFYASSRLIRKSGEKDSSGHAGSYTFEIPALNLKHLNFSIYIWNLKNEDFYITDASVKLFTLPSTWNNTL